MIEEAFNAFQSLLANLEKGIELPLFSMGKQGVEQDSANSSSRQEDGKQEFVLAHIS